MVNKVILVGNLGQDPGELRKIGSDNCVVDISIATSRTTSGAKVTDWHSVTCWGKTAETVHKYLKKGSKVYVEGRLTYDSWEDKETGQKRKKAKITAETVRFISSKSDADAAPPVASDKRKFPPNMHHSSVPF